MRTKQDSIPTHLLPHVMAMDAHGRVLRRPYFLTKEEHDAEMDRASRAWAELVSIERMRKEALTGAMEDLIAENENLNRESERLRSECEMLVNLKVRRSTKIHCRARFHWLLRRLLKID